MDAGSGQVKSAYGMNERHSGEKDAPDDDEPLEESMASLLKRVARVPSLAPGTADMVPPAELGLPETPQVGEVLSQRYRLLELLGEGGMGVVYAARNLRTGKEVAVKVLLPGSFRRVERLERFVREARAAGRIRHPNVVDVYDVESEGETPLLVMERLHGESLRARMSAGPLTPDAAVRLVLGAMQGVMEAHRQGVIHRDLKPENIFLALEPGRAEPLPKVLDFGVSRLLPQDGTTLPGTSLTHTGHVLGTPSYMPLEQLRGQSDLDARADVFALGVILYEALAGKRPYEAANTHDLVVRMATEPPVALQSRAPHVDGALERIVMRCLARDPEDRPASVAELASELERWLSGDFAILEQPDIPAAQTSFNWLPLLLAGIALVLAWWAWPSAPREVPVVRAPAAPVSVTLKKEPEKAAPVPAPALVEPAPQPQTPPAASAPAATHPHRPKKHATPGDQATELDTSEF